MKPAKIKALQVEGKKLSVRIINPRRPGEPYQAVVESRSDGKLGHLVTVKFDPNGDIHAECTCPWSEHGGIACSHVIATLSQLAQRKRATLSFWLTPEDARRQKHRTFRLLSSRRDRRRETQESIWITTRHPAV